MTTRLGYRVNNELKKEYDSLIENKYGNKHGKCGKTIENLMKLYLTLHGDDSYKNDQGVNEMLSLFTEKFNCTHTQNSENNETIRKNMEKDVVQRQNRYRENHMDQFVSCFLREYGEYHQVSMNELKKLVMNVHGVTDPRSIQNRVDYLKATGYIESFAPNVYNIRL